MAQAVEIDAGSDDGTGKGRGLLETLLEKISQLHNLRLKEPFDHTRTVNKDDEPQQN